MQGLFSKWILGLACLVMVTGCDFANFAGKADRKIESKEPQESVRQGAPKENPKKAEPKNNREESESVNEIDRRAEDDKKDKIDRSNDADDKNDEEFDSLNEVQYQPRGPSQADIENLQRIQQAINGLTINAGLLNMNPGNGRIGPDPLNPLIYPGGDTPLVLDWDRDGKISSLKRHNGQTASFDIDGIFGREELDWIGPKDALLVLDLNRNGVIDDGTELFGNGMRIKKTNKRAKDGFQALRQYDQDWNGVIDADDYVFNLLQVWVDANGNGRSEQEELTPLFMTDVVALEVRPDNRFEAIGPSSAVALQASYITRKGTFLFGDVFFFQKQLAGR